MDEAVTSKSRERSGEARTPLPAVSPRSGAEGCGHVPVPQEALVKQERLHPCSQQSPCSHPDAGCCSFVSHSLGRLLRGSDEA